MKPIFNIILILSISVFFIGCILTHPGCITSGHTGAYECGRYADRYDSIKNYEEELKKLNENVDVLKYGRKLSNYEVNEIYNRFCTRYENETLPIRIDLAADFKIDLGKYYTQKFCLTHTKYRELGLYEKETRYEKNQNYGDITWYITDGKKVYDYSIQPISYFANGKIKYGIN